jgi:hypothetical protein
MNLVEEADEEIDEMSEIVADNSLSRELFKYIALKDEELEKECKSGSGAVYRAQLIRALAYLYV